MARATSVTQPAMLIGETLQVVLVLFRELLKTSFRVNVTERTSVPESVFCTRVYKINLHSFKYTFACKSEGVREDGGGKSVRMEGGRGI